MGALSPILRSLQGGLVAFWCPGCDQAHAFGVEPPAKLIWSWDRNVEAPTFNPSLLIQSFNHAGPTPVLESVCHSFVRQGRIEFLSDCTHALAGQTVPIPPWPHPVYEGDA